MLHMAVEVVVDVRLSQASLDGTLSNRLEDKIASVRVSSQAALGEIVTHVAIDVPLLAPGHVNAVPGRRRLSGKVEFVHLHAPCLKRRHQHDAYALRAFSRK